MTYMNAIAQPRSRVLQIEAYLVATILFAGASATVAFDLFGQFISPLLKGVASPWLGAKLVPIPLAQVALANLTGIAGKELRALGLPHGLHILTGLVLYLLGWLLVARPVWQRIAGGLYWAIPATAYGIGVWVLALYGMAHLVAGNQPFLDFGSITWVALWGHIVFALVAAGVI